MDNLLDVYNINDLINIVQLVYRRLDNDNIINDLKRPVVKGLRKDLLFDSRDISRKRVGLLPLNFYMSENDKLNIYFDDNVIPNIIYKDPLNNKHANVINENFVTNYYKYNSDPYPLSKYDAFYLYKNNIVCLRIIDDTNVYKDILTRAGLLVTKIHDILDVNIPNIAGKFTNFTRRSNNLSLTFKNNIAESHNIDIKVTPIRQNKNEKLVFINNTNIGTLDLETYVNSDKISKVYAAGFYVKNMKDSPYKVYINSDTLDSDHVIIRCFNEMLKPKYNNYIFYVHNFSKYDVSFILKALVNFNNKINKESFKLKLILKNKSILALDISFKSYFSSEDIINNIENGRRYKESSKIRILDSFLMLNSSLADLGKIYEVDVLKGYFPHEFVNEKTLFYEGDRPSYYYSNTSLEEYKSINKYTKYSKDNI